MRTRDIKPNTEYADADGRKILTGKTVEREWRLVAPADGGNYFTERDTDGATTKDPWSTSPGRKARELIRGEDGTVTGRVIRRGIKASYINSLTGEKQIETVVDPAVIKGTWEQYAGLHAAKLENDRWRAEGRKAAEEKTAELNKRLDQLTDGAYRLSVRPLFTIAGQDRPSSFIHQTAEVTGFELAVILTLEDNDLVEQAVAAIC